MKKILIGGIILFIIIYLGINLYRLNYLPHKKYSNEYFAIETYHSMIDKDQDEIDDQTDILKNVREYVQTKPKYKSKYYDGGYPNDSYGVCTDVVAFGLKGAGYDLMELVFEDVKEHRDWYLIEVIDKNIDFRRVRNLKVYFEKHAISLTKDIEEIEQWQGGDIVIFENHIGIISDKRNKKGIPFVIHHAGIYQREYEEDILSSRKDIVGHYRIS